MTIGLITEPKSCTKEYFFKRILKIPVAEKLINTNNPFELNIQILPYSHKSLEAMSPLRLNNLINKKIRFFQKSGISGLILSDYLYGLCKTKSIDTTCFANGSGTKIFFALIPLCLRQTAKKSGINLFSANVCIRDTKMDRISEYLIRELCFDTKTIYLCTQNLKSAYAFCESFFDETGLWLNICDQLNFRYDVLIDVDCCQIKIGNDLYIRNAQFGFDFNGYQLCQTDVAALIPGFSSNSVTWVYSYYE